MLVCLANLRECLIVFAHGAYIVLVLKLSADLTVLASTVDLLTTTDPLFACKFRCKDFLCYRDATTITS